jgi:hypothetical protein
MPAGLFLLRGDGSNTKCKITFDYDYANNSYKLSSAYCVVETFETIYFKPQKKTLQGCTLFCLSILEGEITLNVF